MCQVVEIGTDRPPSPSFSGAITLMGTARRLPPLHLGYGSSFSKYLASPREKLPRFFRLVTGVDLMPLPRPLYVPPHTTPRTDTL